MIRGGRMSLRKVDGRGTTWVLFVFFLFWMHGRCPLGLRWVWSGAFAWVFNNNFFLMLSQAFSTFDNIASLSVRVEVLLKVRHLLEALWAVEDRAQVGLLSCMSPHVVKEAFNALEEFPAMLFITRVVGHCLRNQGQTILVLRLRIVQTSLESKLTE